MEKQGSVERLECVGCGYDLRGLGRGGRCPECGVEIAESELGERLEDVAPGRLRMMAIGAAAGAADGVLIVAYFIIGVADPPLTTAGEWLWRAADGLVVYAPLLFLVAAWLMTSSPGTRLRRRSEGLATVVCWSAAVYFMIALASPYNQSRAFETMYLLVSTAASVLLLWYLRGLMWHGMDQKLREYIAWLMAALGLYAVVWLLATLVHDIRIVAYGLMVLVNVGWVAVMVLSWREFVRAEAASMARWTQRVR